MTNHDDTPAGDDRTGGDGSPTDAGDRTDAIAAAGQNEQSDQIDQLGRAAGAELRREPSAESLARVAAAGRRRRTARTAGAGAAAAAACVAVALGVIALRDSGDSRVTENPQQPGTTRPSTTAVATTTAPDTTADSTTPAAEAEPATPDPGPNEPIEIGATAQFVWGDGVVLGAYVDDGDDGALAGGRFVAFDAERFVAPALPEPTADRNELPPQQPTALLDRTGTPSEYVTYDEGCGAIVASPAFTPFPDVASGGWMATAGHPFVTLDGSAPEDDPSALDAVLLAAGIGEDELADIERLTPTVSLGGGPALETLVSRYDPDLVAAPGNRESRVWFAVWDPDTGELLTVAGDPSGAAAPFAVNGEGPVDVDGDGAFEITITSGTHVALVRLSDGVTLATAERCPVTLEVSVAFDGFGEPIDYTVRSTSSEQWFSGRAAGDEEEAGPFVFELPLGVTGTYVVVDTPDGPIEYEVLLGAGRNVVRIDARPDHIGSM